VAKKKLLSSPPKNPPKWGYKKKRSILCRSDRDNMDSDALVYLDRILRAIRTGF